MNNFLVNHSFKFLFVGTMFLALTTLSCAKDNYEFIETSESTNTVLDTASKKHIANLFQIIISEKATIHQVINELKEEKQFSDLGIENSSTQRLFQYLKKAARRNNTLEDFQNDLKFQNIELTLLLTDIQINRLYENIRKNTFLGYLDSLSSAL